MYSKLLDKIIWVLEKIVMVLLGVAIVIIACQVFCRYVLESPLWWSEQTARCLFVWMMMLSVPIIFRRKGAVAFDLIVEMMPDRPREIVHILSQSVVLFFAVSYFYYGIQLCIETGDRIISGIEIPQNLMYAAAPVAMFLLSMVIIEQIVQEVKAVVGKGKKEEAK